MIKAKLIVDDLELNLLSFHFGFKQNADYNGRISEMPIFLGLNVVVETQKKLNLAEWASSANLTKQLELHINTVQNNGKTRKIYFYDCHLVNWQNHFTSTGIEPLTEVLKITAGGVKEGSSSDTEYSAYWRETFNNDTIETTPLEEPTPNIVNISWINSETKENIEEASYTENISLSAQIENQENGSATITITKENETEFEKGLMQLSFEEQINEDGTIELTPLEIKEQWEDFTSNNAAKLIAKITHANINKKSKPLTITPTPKVQVNFRPHKGYKGEFGFDWIRMGDTNRDGDKDWYANLMGKYFLDAAHTIPNTDINDSTRSSFWKKDLKMYNSWVKSFKHKIDIDWKKKAGRKDFLYPVPMITLLPNDNVATLDVHIEIVKKPKKITLKPKTENTGIQLNTTDITIKEGKLEGFLKIKCTKPLKNHLIIDVLADDLLCGQLMVLQNNTSAVRDVNVVLVNVLSDINGLNRDVTGNPIFGGKTMLDNALKQALVKGNIKHMTTELNVKGSYEALFGVEISNTFRDKFATKHGRNYKIDKNSRNLLKYLNDKFDSQFSDYLKNNKVDYRVYFIGESGAWNGFASKKQKAGVYFPGHNEATIPHELMHAMGLPHTFVNSEADSAAEYTYLIGETTNVMDYSHQDTYGNMDRNSLFYWQMKVLNPKLK